jgi:hypothetical protein
VGGFRQERNAGLLQEDAAAYAAGSTPASVAELGETSGIPGRSDAVTEGSPSSARTAAAGRHDGSMPAVLNKTD